MFNAVYSSSYIENLFILAANKLSMLSYAEETRMDLDVKCEKTCGDNVVKISTLKLQHSCMTVLLI
jgi:hypothetical protein